MSRERPREAQKGRVGIEQACHAFGWKLPQSDLRPGRLPTDFFMEPQRKPPADNYELGFQTGPPHKQNYVRPGRLPTSRITTREAELRPGTLCIFCMLPTEDDDVMELPVKLPVRASSQRSPETRREPQRGTERPAPQLRLSQTRRSFVAYRSTM